MEKLTFDGNTVFYHENRNGVSVIVKFETRKDSEYNAIKQQLKSAQSKANIALNGKLFMDGFKSHIDEVATWMRPCPEMMKSRGLTEAEVWEKLFKSHRIYNKATKNKDNADALLEKSGIFKEDQKKIA